MRPGLARNRRPRPGVDVPLGSRLGLQLMAMDYIGKFDTEEATLIDVDTRTTHNWAFSAGIRLGL